MKSVGELKPESSTTCWIFRYSGRGILTVTLLSRTTVKGLKVWSDSRWFRPAGAPFGSLRGLAGAKRRAVEFNSRPPRLRCPARLGNTPIALQW